MKFLADENLYEPVITYLREKGHEVLSVRESGLSGISDEQIYEHACSDQYCIITMDKDFSRLFRFPPHNCNGIIVLRLYRKTVSQTLMLFKIVFERLSEEDILRNLVVISPERVRIKRTASL